MLNLDQRFEFECDGVPYASMLREMTSDPRKILGSATYRYVVTLRTGDRLEAAGYGLTRWTIVRGPDLIARIESEGYVHTIDLLDDGNGPFVMTMVMAVARLNKPPDVGDQTD